MRRWTGKWEERVAVGNHGHNLLMMFEDSEHLVIDLSSSTPHAEKRLHNLRVGEPNPFPPITTVTINIRTGEVTIPSYQPA